MLRPDERVGTSIGPYLVDGLIGVGGMGRVYAATGPDGVRVAVKMVKQDLARDAMFRKRFAREAHIAQTVSSPHVVPVLGTGEHEGIPYMVARFIDGRSLELKLKEEGRMDLPAVVDICNQVTIGLEALWAAGMVHRDVKPGNVLLDRQDTAWITDFGLAKDPRGSILTLPGQALGSMDYMAPEQIRGEDVTPQSDLYALGCMLFECLHGLPPFADRPGMRVMTAHLQDEPPDPPGVSAQVAIALKSAMRKAPEDRPRSGTEYARALTEAAGIPAPPAPR